MMRTMILSLIHLFQAVDNDEPNTPNSIVRYRIAQTPPGLESNFTINSTSGEITLVRPLDYERLDPSMKGKITLNISAYDGGTPQKSSVISVQITVEVRDHSLYLVFIIEFLRLSNPLTKS